MSTNARKLANFMVAAGLIVFAAGVLLLSNWRQADRYEAVASFAGCYADQSGNEVILTHSGNLQWNTRTIGQYRIVAPLAGKHGYLVEAAGLNLHRRGDHIYAQVGTGAFFWPISTAGDLTIIFAPDTSVGFRRVSDCSSL